MTPTAWGSSRSFVFASVGGSFPQSYINRSDLIAALGVGVGNAYKTVGLVGNLNINDVSNFSNYSANFLVTKYIHKGSSISAGALHVFANKQITDGGPSYYIVFSHAVQNFRSKVFYYSRLTYSIGAGTGRFLDKSPKDIASGKGKYGSAVFGNVSFEAIKNLNFNLEWTGLNLCIGTSWRPSYKFPALGIGVADITRFSGDKPRFICQLGYAFVFNNK